MRIAMPTAGRPADYTVREVAWILGVEPSQVCRAIRIGTLRAGWRRGRLVVPAGALARLLGEPTEVNAAQTTTVPGHGSRPGGAPW